MDKLLIFLNFTQTSNVWAQKRWAKWIEWKWLSEKSAKNGKHKTRIIWTIAIKYCRRIWQTKLDVRFIIDTKWAILRWESIGVDIIEMWIGCTQYNFIIIIFIAYFPVIGVVFVVRRSGVHYVKATYCLSLWEFWWAKRQTTYHVCFYRSYLCDERETISS